MDALEALLGASIEVEDEVYVKRLNTHFRIKALSDDDLSAIREQATYTVGKGANRKKEIDDQEVNALIVATACVSPDFNNADLKKKYGAADASGVVRKALLAGEVAKIQDAILRLSGFDDSEEEIEEIKN